MRGAVPPLPRYAFMVWCLLKQEVRLHGLLLIKHMDSFISYDKFSKYYIYTDWLMADL